MGKCKSSGIRAITIGRPIKEISLELITTKVCMTKDIGVHGNLFGGAMLAWLDEAALAYTCQVADSTRMVTRSMSEVIFEKPV